MLQKITKNILITCLVFLILGCMVVGEKASLVSLEIDISDILTGSGKFKDSGADLFSENKAAFYVEVTAEDITDDISAIDTIATDSDDRTMSAVFEVPSGRQRMFSAVLFMITENQFYAYNNQQDYFLDLEDGDNKNITVKVKEMLYGSAKLTVSGADETVAVYCIDRYTNIKLYAVECEQQEDVQICTLPRLPLNRELIPVVMHGSSVEKKYLDKLVVIQDENEEYELTLEL